MRFEKLILENFSSYYKKHQIDFLTTNEKPVIIIVGGGGKGKTSIFDALNWALYGKQYELVLKNESQKNITDYLNETALQEATQSGYSVEMACTLFFEHEGKHYRIQQSIVAKQDDKKIEITDQMSTLFEFSITGNSNEITNIDSFLNEILPSNVRDYFLFNGDRINRLALPGSSEEIRDGIYRVVDLELLQNGAEHLREAAKTFRKGAKDLSVGEVADIENKYSDAYEELDSFKKKVANLNEEKRALDDKIEIVDAKLRGLDEIKELQKKRDVLKAKYALNENNYKQIVNDQRSLAATASLGFALAEIVDLETVLSEKREKGEIPSSISKSLLQDILEIGKCICGTEFSDGDHVFNHLNQRLEYEKKKQEAGQDLLDLYFGLSSAETEIKRAKQRLSELEKRRVQVERTLAEIDKELNDILKKLVNAPEEEISKLAAALREYTDELSNIRLNIQSYQSKIREKEEEIRSLQAKRDELGAKQEKVRRFQQRSNLAQNAADELQRIFERFAEDSRIEVQNFTREEFQKFIPTAKALKIGIDSEFHYDVRDQNENPALQQLSNGQKQALSLAYITSISRVSEKNPPLVIDMPFGRLDEDVQDNIATRLPELASQVILLVLPGPEWNEHTQSILRSRSSVIYHLDFDDALRQTTIRKE